MRHDNYGGGGGDASKCAAVLGWDRYRNEDVAFKMALDSIVI